MLPQQRVQGLRGAPPRNVACPIARRTKTYNHESNCLISLAFFSYATHYANPKSMLVARGLPRTLPAHPLALTIGNFDGLHLGHRGLLANVKAKAAELAMHSGVMTFEPHPREFFSPHAAPTRLSSLREKLEHLAAEGIDRVQVMPFNKAFSSLSPDAFIERAIVGLNTKWVLIGDDFRFGAKRAGDFAALSAAGTRHGFAVEAMPTLKSADGTRVSSSLLREVLSAGDVERAATLLGRPYRISGRVMHGDKIGRTLGFPTANIQMRHNRPPLSGIFAVWVHGAAAQPVLGAASIGVRPTVTQSNEVRFEVFLLDFSGDLYGRHLKVDFMTKIRPEEKYQDMETLAQQIAADVAQIRGFFASPLSRITTSGAP